MYRLNSHDFINFKVNREIKINEYLREQGLSSRFITKSIKLGNIYLNSRKIRKNKKLKLGDIISVRFEDEEPNGKVEYRDLEILYEDEDVIAVNKPKNMVTHTAKDDSEGTLLNYMLGYFEKNKIKRKVRFVNRLDRDTSGIVLVAKNSHAQDKLSSQFKDEMVKKYIAICKGHFDEKNGIIDVPIATSEDGIRREVNCVIGKHSKTSYEVIDEYEDMSLVLLTLHTGRTHQLRVHLNHIGHPIIGDELYFEKSDLIKGQALHSYSLKFKKVRSNEFIELNAKVPEEFNFYKSNFLD